MNNQQLKDLFMLDPDIDAIVTWMTHNDPNGTYSKCDLILHPMEYAEILEQWREDAYIGADDPLAKLFDEFMDIIFLIHVIKNEGCLEEYK